MAGNARTRLSREFIARMYPAFSRRATQVCILSSALEKVAFGAPDAPAIARAALFEADAFGWRQREALRLAGAAGLVPDEAIAGVRVAAPSVPPSEPT